MSLVQTLSKIATKLIEMDGLEGALNEGKIPKELLEKIDMQISSYRSLSAEVSTPIGWSIDDYAVPVDVIVGEAEIDAIAKQVERLDDIVSSWEAQLSEAIEAFEDVANRRLVAVEADYAVTDATKVLEDLFDSGAHPVDSALGSNQLGMAIIEIHDDLLPRLSDRATALEKLEIALSQRIEAMDAHLMETRSAIEELQKHFRRLIDLKQNELIDAKLEGQKSAQLENIRAGAERITAMRERVFSGNKQTRSRVAKIVAAQNAAASKARDLGMALAIVQIGISVAGLAASTSAGADGDIQTINVAPKPTVGTDQKKLTKPVSRPVPPRKKIYTPPKPVKLPGLT